MEEADAAEAKAIARLKKILGCAQTDIDERGIFVNRDPRGCALKIGDDFTRDWNNSMLKVGREEIYTDMGGYGLIAPDLTTK